MKRIGRVTIPTTAGEATTHGGTNAAIAVLLGGYLAICLYQGNLGNLAAAARQDFLGDSQHPAFWRWAMALLILMALAKVPAVQPIFGPALVIVLIAMLINSAENHPQQFASLQSGIAALFGRQSAQGG